MVRNSIFRYVFVGNILSLFILNGEITCCKIPTIYWISHILYLWWLSWVTSLWLSDDLSERLEILCKNWWKWGFFPLGLRMNSCITVKHSMTRNFESDWTGAKSWSWKDFCLGLVWQYGFPWCDRQRVDSYYKLSWVWVEALFIYPISLSIFDHSCS